MGPLSNTYVATQVGEMVEEEDREQEGNEESRKVRSTAGVEGGAGAADEDVVGEKGSQEEEVEEERDGEEPDEETLAKMSSKEQRLFKIRLMMNKV